VILQFYSTLYQGSSYAYNWMPTECLTNLYMTYNQYDQSQLFFFTEATKLAASGEEYSHLIKLLSPNNALRLKIFVQELPREVAEKTIYGKAHWKEQSVAKQRKRN
jgi:hypothetical protein